MPLQSITLHYGKTKQNRSSDHSWSNISAFEKAWYETYGSRYGTAVRALAYHQCGLGSIPPRCHIWVEFVVCCWLSPCFEGFAPGSPFFLPPQKPTLQNSNSTRIVDPHEKQLRLTCLPLCILFFIYFYLSNSVLKRHHIHLSKINYQLSAK